jgi:hypothetical protein
VEYHRGDHPTSSSCWTPDTGLNANAIAIAPSQGVEIADPTRAETAVIPPLDPTVPYASTNETRRRSPGTGSSR